MIMILFVRFMIAVFIGYIFCLVLAFIFVNDIFFVVQTLVFIWHIFFAVESLPRIIKPLEGQWLRKALIIVAFIFLSCTFLALVQFPQSVYFVVIYTTFFCETLYVECQFNMKAFVTNKQQDSNVLAAVFIEKAVFNRKRLKEALDRKFSDLKLKILDFAGDKEYYSYHHMFLKQHAIYIVVFNMAEFVNNDFRDITTGGKRLQFWFESVCSHVPPNTPIFLVGTHRGNIDRDCMKILDDHLRKILWHTYCDELVVMNDPDKLIFFPVENSLGNDDAVVQALQVKIMSVVEQGKETIGCDIPLSWIKIQDAILSLQEKKEAKYCITLDEFPMAIDSLVSSTCKWSKETLKYFHEKGLVIYLDRKQDLDLSNWILLKPQILVDIIIQLITPPPENTHQRGLRRAWHRLQNEGMLANSLLKSIISEVQENEEAMTAFLEEYDLICPLVNKNVMCNVREQGETQPITHFVPSLLPMSVDGDVPVWDDDDTDKKFYVFFARFLPEPLFHRLLSRAHKNSKVEFLNGPTVLHRDAGKFWMSPWLPYRLRLMTEQKMIEVTFSCR